MSTPKFTPGPWVPTAMYPPLVVGHDGYFVAQMCGAPAQYREREAADLALITSAPLLHDVKEAARDYMRGVAARWAASDSVTQGIAGADLDALAQNLVDALEAYEPGCILDHAEELKATPGIGERARAALDAIEAKRER